MTLIAALGCTDGLVLAADSASSDTEVGTKQPVVKIRQLENLGIAYGGSGDVGLLQKLNDSLTALPAKLTLKRIRQEVKKLVIPVLKESREQWVQFPQQGFHEPPVAILLMAGVLDQTPWILEIERDGRDTMYGEDYGFFAAIGSGKPWAQAIFRPHLYSSRNLRVGKVLMCRVLEDSIDLAMGGLAKPVHMCTVSLDGKISHIADQDLESISQTCEIWRSIERDALGSALSPNRGQAEGELEIPRPGAP